MHTHFTDIIILGKSHCLSNLVLSFLISVMEKELVAVGYGAS